MSACARLAAGSAATAGRGGGLGAPGRLCLRVDDACAIVVARRERPGDKDGRARLVIWR